ncbi:hypothetical protein Tco_1570391 [Tanacetum coccineum]
MPRRPPHKRKRYAFENDGHNQRACPSKKEEGSAIDVVTPSTSTRGGTGSTRGGKTFARGGSASARDGKTSARGGSTSARGGQTSIRGSCGFEMSASQGVRMTRSGIRIRGGVYIRGGSQFRNSPAMPETRSATNEAKRTGLRTVNGKVVRSKGKGDGSRSRMYPNGIRPIGYGVSWDSVDGETMLGDSMGIPRPAWPEGITPKDNRIHAAESQAQAVISLSASQPLAS